MLPAENVELGRRNPGREKVDAASDVLWHAKGSSEGVDGACGVSQNGEFGDFKSLADGVYIIYRIVRIAKMMMEWGAYQAS